MAEDVQQIATIKSQTLARMAEITAAPKPTYQIDDQKVAWNEYLRQLQQTVDWCNQKLAGLEPFEFQSQGYTLSAAQLPSPVNGRGVGGEGTLPLNQQAIFWTAP